jgi:hypothetical protein
MPTFKRTRSSWTLGGAVSIAVLGLVAIFTGPATASPPGNAATSASASVPDATSGCTAGTNLVPTCGVLWGAAAGGFTRDSRTSALHSWEQLSGRKTSVFHSYHSGSQLFPTKSEIAVAHEKGNPRLLAINWKVDSGTTWSKVAAGGEDARIDREAAYLKHSFTDKFFLILHHEPENDVRPAKGSGMTASDFAAMFRHTILRLRADGVHNAVSVVVFENYAPLNDASWWPQLYPGDDVVDWIGVDTYLNADPGQFHYGDFASMVNRSTKPSAFPGFYTWATTHHRGKPLFLAEWGVYGQAAHKASVFNTVLPQIKSFPAIKAMVYFDTPRDQAGRDIRINSSASSLAAFRKIATNSIFKVKVP